MWSVRRSLLAILLLTAATSPTAADAQTPVTVGSTVRLTLSGGRLPLTGSLSSAEAGTLTLTRPDGEVTSVAQGEILQAELLMRRRNTLRGTLIGGGVGLVGGVVFAATADDGCGQDQIGLCDGLSRIVGSAVLVFAPLAGAALGALVGTLIVSERWVPAFLPNRVDRSVALQWTLPVRR